MVEDVLDLDGLHAAKVGDVVAREVLAQRAEPRIDFGWLRRQGKLDEDADPARRPVERVDAGPELTLLDGGGQPRGPSPSGSPPAIRPPAPSRRARASLDS